MTYIQYDSSHQDGLSLLLFSFVQGSTEYNYNSGVVPVIFDSKTWLPLSIGCSDFAQTNEIQKDAIQVKIPNDSDLAATFNVFYPEITTSLTVYHGHTTDPDEQFIVAWKGKVTATEPTGKQLTLECEPIFTSLKRPGLRARYTRVCRHLLYETGCNVDKSLFEVVAEVADIDASGTVITIPDADSSLYPAGYFNSGMLETSDGFGVLILDHTGDQITLIRPFQTLVNQFNSASAVMVSLFPGCDLSEQTCFEKFNNLLNHGGFSRIPSDTPFNGSSIV